ncbi:MAG: IS4 family transposase [Saprospiraceae bacterium]
MVDIQSFTINPQDMATEYKGSAILEILEGELEYLNLSRLKIMALMIEAIVKTQTICLWKLCEVIPSNAKALSINRRLQRFVSEVVFNPLGLAKIIVRLCGTRDKVYLIMDRTNWKLGNSNINILMLSMSYEGKGIPLFWKFLDKRGNSNEDERVELLNQFKKAFPELEIAGFLADREFIGEDWFKKLNELNIPFVIRVRNNFQICRKYKSQNIKNLFRRLSVNEYKIIHRKRMVLNVPLFISGMKILDKENRVDYCIVVSNVDHDNSLEVYRKRWQIECMFKNLKSSGFDIEATHLTKHERLNALLSVVSIAYVWVVKVADKMVQAIKSTKTLSHGRRPISEFRQGLRELKKALFISNTISYKDYVQILSYT